MSRDELQLVAPGVWAWVQGDGTWWLNNAGIIRTDDGLILVDSCATERRTRALLDAAAGVGGGARLRLAINTHAHGDHCYGNSLLPPETPIVGHPHMRETLEADAVIDGCPPFWTPLPDWGGVSKRLPDLVVDDRLDIVNDDIRIEVRHPGYPAHTRGDLIAWLPERSVLFTGDLLFAGLTPLVFMGSVVGADRALDFIADFDPAVVVPGHGRVLDRAGLAEELQRHRLYYRFVRETAAAGRQAGWSPLETAHRADLGDFATWLDSERLVLNLHRAYADADGTEVDPISAFRDAVAFHGSPMLTQL